MLSGLDTAEEVEGGDDAALCESMIVMAHKLGIRVIAEGIETQQQSDLLKKNTQWNYQEFLRAPVAKQIPQVQQYQQQMARLD